MDLNTPVLLPVPAGADNYAHLWAAGQTAAVVDPAEAGPVLDRLAAAGWTLEAILITHAHVDHTAGVHDLVRHTGARVIGPRTPALPEVTDPAGENDFVEAAGLTLRAWATPGHTPEHLCYILDGPAPIAFTGDTLFGGGCGRVAGGAYAALWNSLLRLRALPPDTCLFFGHEYTLENLEFALHLEPDRAPVRDRLARERRRRAHGEPTCPSLLKEECATNPFLRADDPALASALGLPGASPPDVFTRLRQMKDRW
jgi:hydroxyacylglutathione hydrolase